MATVRNGRAILDKDELDPNWVHVPPVEVMGLAELNRCFGTKYKATDTDLIAQDLQINTLAALPYGKAFMTLFDKKEVEARMAIFNKQRQSVDASVEATHLLEQVLRTLDGFNTRLAQLEGKEHVKH